MSYNDLKTLINILNKTKLEFIYTPQYEFSTNLIYNKYLTIRTNEEDKPIDIVRELLNHAKYTYSEELLEEVTDEILKLIDYVIGFHNGNNITDIQGITIGYSDYENREIDFKFIGNK